MKFHSLADKAIIFYNKFWLVYIIILVNWVKLDPPKQQKEVITKKRTGVGRIIFVVSLVVKKQRYVSEKSTWFGWF